MVGVAQEAAGSEATIDGLTACFGAALICNEQALAVAANAVVALRDTIRARKPSGVIIAAFGDPGQEQLADELGCPVTGIAEASLAEAARGARRFVVVTTTPDLVAAITRTTHRYGLSESFLGVRLTPGDPRASMNDAGCLEEELFRACEAAIRQDAAQAIVIGGGPLAVAARALKGRLSIPIIEPVPAAIRLALCRCIDTC
jgi:allantoin racemase